MVGAEPARTWEQNGLSIDCSSWQLFCVEETILSLLFLSFFFLDTKRRCDAPWKRGRKREWLSEVRINCAICLRLLSVRQSSSAWHLHYTWEITSLERNLQLARSWSVPRFFFEFVCSKIWGLITRHHGGAYPRGCFMAWQSNPFCRSLMLWCQSFWLSLRTRARLGESRRQIPPSYDAVSS